MAAMDLDLLVRRPLAISTWQILRLTCAYRSVVAFGLGFGWLGVHHPDEWHTATGLYMIGLIAYQVRPTG